MHLGDYTEDYTKVNFTFFTTVDGTPTALAGSPAISVYKGNAVGQSTAGVTLTEGFDGNTGSNQVLIDLSADAFYAVGEDYTVYLSAGTLGGVSVIGRPVAYFSIENRRTEDVIAETDKLTLVNAGAGVSGSIIEEIENRPTTAMRGTDNVVLAGPTKAEMDTAHGLLATPADILTTALTESYAANGVAPTLTEILFACHQYLMQFGISGTSYAVRKLNDTDPAFVVTLDDATNPTDAKRV